MAAPAQPKKIVAPTVSQINAEFVTQVRFGVCVCVCVWLRTFRPRRLGEAFSMGLGALRRH